MIAHSGDAREVESQGVVGDRQDDFGGIGQVVARLIEEYVTQACADDDACNNPGEEAVDLILGKADLFLLVHVSIGGVGGGEGENVHDAIPFHLETTQGKGGAVHVCGNQVPPR